jgi:hypothetical protein
VGIVILNVCVRRNELKELSHNQATLYSLAFFWDFASNPYNSLTLRRNNSLFRRMPCGLKMA